MARVAGYVSKKNVRRWLDNYAALEAGDQIDDGQVRVVNSGPKSADGMTAGKLHKIMLDEAINNLPPLARHCVRMKWVRPIRVKDALKVLRISRDVWDNRLQLAVQMIHERVNGPLYNYMALLEAVERGVEVDPAVLEETAAAALFSAGNDNA